MVNIAVGVGHSRGIAVGVPGIGGIVGIGSHSRGVNRTVALPVPLPVGDVSRKAGVHVRGANRLVNIAVGVGHGRDIAVGVPGIGGIVGIGSHSRGVNRTVALPVPLPVGDVSRKA